MKCTTGNWWWVFLCLLLIGLMWLSHGMAYDDALNDERNYCLGVLEGKYPDYRDLVKTGTCAKYEEE